MISCHIFGLTSSSVVHLQQPVFSRPAPISRSRSSTVTSECSRAETPGLSISDTSSISSASQSSIDIGHLNSLITSATRPTSSIVEARARQRARGTAHRRRISEARMSRSSVYETIEEEPFVFSNSPARNSTAPSVPASLSRTVASPRARDSVYIVGSDGHSLMLSSEEWDDERGITDLRRYFALRDEADHTVAESKRVWPDTPFSTFAVQGEFEPYNTLFVDILKFSYSFPTSL